MELFLNLLWLLLAVPAVWIWRKATCRQAHSTGQSRQCVLILACLLIMLFPVVSASDDLQAMRPEVEESATRSGLRSSCHSKLSTLLGICGNYILSAARAFVSPDRSRDAGHRRPSWGSCTDAASSTAGVSNRNQDSEGGGPGTPAPRSDSAALRCSGGQGSE
jgi:hypothetical protein